MILTISILYCKYLYLTLTEFKMHGNLGWRVINYFGVWVGAQQEMHMAPTLQRFICPLYVKVSKHAWMDELELLGASRLSSVILCSTSNKLATNMGMGGTGTSLHSRIKSLWSLTNWRSHIMNSSRSTLPTGCGYGACRTRSTRLPRCGCRSKRASMHRIRCSRVS
jgi:hypothetical protein